MSTAENKETLQLVNQLIDGLKNEYRLEEKDINELLSIEADLKSKEQSGGLTNEFLSENLEKLAILCSKHTRKSSISTCTRGTVQNSVSASSSS